MQCEYYKFTLTSESFCLENHLQRWEIDNEQLSDNAQGYGYEEWFICEQADAEHALGLRTARQGVEHIEQDETGKGHGGVSGSDLFIGHLKWKQYSMKTDPYMYILQFDEKPYFFIEHPQGASDYDGSREQDVDHKGASYHMLFRITRLLFNDFVIHWFHA